MLAQWVTTRDRVTPPLIPPRVTPTICRLVFLVPASVCHPPPLLPRPSLHASAPPAPPTSRRPPMAMSLLPRRRSFRHSWTTSIPQRSSLEVPHRYHLKPQNPNSIGGLTVTAPINPSSVEVTVSPSSPHTIRPTPTLCHRRRLSSTNLNSSRTLRLSITVRRKLLSDSVSP
jgi:hypothetical protein